MRSLYRERHELISAMLRDDLASVLKAIPSEAGLHLSALAPGMSPEECDGRPSAAPLPTASSPTPWRRSAMLEPRPAGVVIGYGVVQLADIPDGCGPRGQPSRPEVSVRRIR